jgi:hypothetical protein
VPHRAAQMHQILMLAAWTIIAPPPAGLNVRPGG